MYIHIYRQTASGYYDLLKEMGRFGLVVGHGTSRASMGGPGASFELSLAARAITVQSLFSSDIIMTVEVFNTSMGTRDRQI